jgi:hypothetical protein
MLSKSEIIKYYKKDTAYSLIEAFYNELVSQEDQKLLELAFAKKINQEQLDNFLKDWDIEKYGEGKSMMLSYVMKTNPQLKFSNYEKPRLEGLLKYHRFHNLKLISHYNKIVKALNQENIFPMILKGGAMKHIRPDLSRSMGDIDILILEADLEKSREICKNLGYEEEVHNHSIDLHLPNSKAGTVDIHKYIDLETDYNKDFLKDLFSRGKKEKIFGSEAFIPCFEDLLFLGMINLARNLNNKTSLGGILYSLFDFKYLIENKTDFDWDLVLKNIAATKTHIQALLAIKFVNRIIPEILPKSLINNNKINKKFTKYCDRIAFNHFFFNDFRQKYKHLNIRDAVKNFENMKYYLVKKPQYFLVKRVVKKSHFLMKTFNLKNSKN